MSVYVCPCLCQRERFSFFFFFNFNSINEGLSLGFYFFSLPAFFVPVERTLEPPASSLPPLLLRSLREGQDLKEDCVTIVIKIMAPPHLPPLPSESTERVKGSTFVLRGQLFNGG